MAALLVHIVILIVVGTMLQTGRASKGREAEGLKRVLMVANVVDL